MATKMIRKIGQNPAVMAALAAARQQPSAPIAGVPGGAPVTGMPGGAPMEGMPGGAPGMKKGGKVKKMSKGGVTRGDGIAQRGHTKGRVI